MHVATQKSIDGMLIKTYCMHSSVLWWMFHAIVCTCVCVYLRC